jgi:hypothetical protein
VQRIYFSLYYETEATKNHGSTEFHPSRQETNPKGVHRAVHSSGQEIHGAQDSLKCFIFENNLHDDFKFKKELELRVARDKSDLLTRVQPYINYEEKRLAENALKSKQSGKSGDNKRCNDDDKAKNQRTRFSDYTLLNSSREIILCECLNIEFKVAGIKAPQPLKECSRTDMTKYRRYHPTRGHDTEQFRKDSFRESFARGSLKRSLEGPESITNFLTSLGGLNIPHNFRESLARGQEDTASLRKGCRLAWE